MCPQTKTILKQKVSVLILAGSRDFGRCSLASRIPTALWPVAGRSSLERMLEQLAEQGINNVLILSGRNKSMLSESIKVDNRLEVEYVEEPMPVGTAGSIREGAENRPGELYILLPSSMTCPPDIDELINEHNKGESDLTVILEEIDNEDCESENRSNGIFVCNASVLEFIPKGGYSDIKEGLIPKLLQAGKSIHAVSLSHQAGVFRDCRDYIKAISNNIEKIAESNNLDIQENNESCTLWTGANVQVDSTARIAGDVILMDNTKVAEGAIVIGPTIIGENVTVGKNAIVANSMVWNDSTINDNCKIERCVLDYNTYIHSHAKINQKCKISLTDKKTHISNSSLLKITKSNFKALPNISSGINQKLQNTFDLHIQKHTITIILSSVFIAFFWSYLSEFKELWEIWLRSDEYSSGLLVPFLAGYVLWLRREDILSVSIKPSLVGLLLFVLAQAMRIFGLFYLFDSAERLSIIVSIAAIVLLLFGWKLLLKVSTVIIFLALMLPWPNRIHSAVSLPLQEISTTSAVFCLEVLGFDIIRQGNVIHIGDSVVAVAEACNGLRMITAFFVISGLVALLINRTWWEKLIVLLSCVPVAFLCNTLRLTITAIVFTKIEGEYWEKIFHDFGGYAMMPLALAFIVGELWLIDKLTIPPEEKKEIIIERQKT